MRIVVIEVQPDNPLVEAHASGVAWRVRLAGTEMNLAENPRDVTGILEGFSNGLFMRTHIATVIRHLRAYWVAPRHDTRASWRTNRSRRIETIEHEAVARHRIQFRSLHEGMAVVSDIAPTLVVGHDQDDVGLARFLD